MSDSVRIELAHAPEERKTTLTLAIIRVLFVATVIAFAVANLDPVNDIRFTLVIEAMDLAVLASARYAIHAGRQRVAAWLVTWMYWTVVTSAALLFGGLEHVLGGAYIVSFMVAGATLGSREAISFAALNIATTTSILIGHMRGWLPHPVTPPSTLNAWIAVTVSLVVGAYLLKAAIDSLEQALKQARANAEAHDAARERLAQAQKMEPVGRLAAGVAHDFNNLLAAITAISGIIRRRIGTDARVVPLLDDHDGATERAAMMTRQLLAFSRARAPSFEVFELDPVLRRTVPVLSRLLGDDVSVSLELHAPGAALRADRGQLEQVLLNLAVNARDAMPNGGTLRIATSRHRDKRTLRIEVTDDGVGIEPASIPRLFEPFFTTKSSGTGLGLATVRDIVDATGGTIEVSSRPQVGTTFVVELPEYFGAADLVSTTEASLPDSAASGMRILLVEDHDLVRRSTRQVLEDAGIDVTAVNDGVEAFSLLEGGSTFDAVVSDLRMARLSGEGLALKLAQTGRLVPFVFMSGHEDRLPEVLESIPVAKRFLPKPVTSSALVRAVLAVTKEQMRRGHAQARPGRHYGVH